MIKFFLAVIIGYIGNTILMSILDKKKTKKTHKREA